MLPTPTSAELVDWLRVAGPGTASCTLRWTPGEGELAFGWASYGGPPLLLHLPAGVEVHVWFDGARRWALDGPEGPLGRSDGRRAVVRDGDAVLVGDELLCVPDPRELLLPSPPHERGGDVAADELLGRPCWRWTTATAVRWVDDETGCLLAQRTAGGTLSMTAFEPGAQVDPARFDLSALDLSAIDPSAIDPSAIDRPPAERSAPPDELVTSSAPSTPAFDVPWWPHGALSYPVAGDPDVPSLLVLLNTGDAGAPQVWVGVAPLGRRAPVRRGVRSRRWDGDDCALSLSWTRRLSDDDVERIVASMPRRWP